MFQLFRNQTLLDGQLSESKIPVHHFVVLAACSHRTSGTRGIRMLFGIAEAKHMMRANDDSVSVAKLRGSFNLMTIDERRLHNPSRMQGLHQNDSGCVAKCAVLWSNSNSAESNSQSVGIVSGLCGSNQSCTAPQVINKNPANVRIFVEINQTRQRVVNLDSKPHLLASFCLLCHELARGL